MLRALLSLAFLFCLQAFSDDYTDRSDSGIYGPSYEKILESMDQLAADNSDFVQVVEYGKSVKGRPLKMMLVMKPTTSNVDRPTMLMTGSTHGNEYLNIEDQLPGELIALAKKSGPVSRYINAGGAYVFVPILNPDGYSSRSRYNAKGVDLNRDWDVAPANHKGFKQIETRALAQRLKELNKMAKLQYRITVDYHCCIGAILHPWSYKKAKLPADDLEAHQAVGEMADNLLDIEYGTTPDILGYSPLGTTKDYYYVEYGALAFTYEGRYRKENKFINEHVSWWQGMANFVNQSLSARPMLSFNLKRELFFLKLAD